MPVKSVLKKLVEKQNLTEEETFAFTQAMTNAEATDAQIGAFLTGLAAKGETVEEIVG